jgi:hypothetical protein
MFNPYTLIFPNVVMFECCKVVFVVFMPRAAARLEDKCNVIDTWQQG